MKGTCWLALLLAAPVALAGSGGGNPYAFLKNGVGARGVALGGAFQSLVDDGSSGYWNPAGYAGTDGWEFFFSNKQPQQGEAWQEEYSPRQLYSSVSLKLEEKTFRSLTFPEMAVAVSINHFALDDFQRTQVVGGNVVDTGERFGDSQTELALHLAWPFFQNLAAVGFSVCGYQQELDERSASGLGATVGAQVNLSEATSVGAKPLLWVLHDLRVGVTARFSTPEVWDGEDEEYEAPPLMCMSVSSDLVGGKANHLVATLGTCKQGIYRTQWRGGLEYTLRLDALGGERSMGWDAVSAQAGFSGLYNGDQDGLSAADQSEYARHLLAGLGCRWHLKELEGSLGLAYDGTLLGNGVQLSLGLSYDWFGE